MVSHERMDSIYPCIGGDCIIAWVTGFGMSCVCLDVPHVMVHRHRHEGGLKSSVTKENGIHDKGIC
jgi:hypothetical protein